MSSLIVDWLSCRYKGASSAGFFCMLLLLLRYLMLPPGRPGSLWFLRSTGGQIHLRCVLVIGASRCTHEATRHHYHTLWEIKGRGALESCNGQRPERAAG